VSPRVLDVGHPGDAVQREGPVLLAQVVARGDVAALDAARLDDARGRAALRVDVAEPDLPPLAGGRLEEGERVLRRRARGRDGCAAGRARGEVTGSAAWSGGSIGSPARWGR
jgi:hypothetical protein